VSFFLKTCQLRRPLNTDTVMVIRSGSQIVDGNEGSAASDNDFIPLSTGSVAELYIDPMLPCVGDGSQ